MGTADGTVGGAVKILDHGPDSERFNLVIVAEGYQANQLSKFATDAQTFVTALSRTRPFDELISAINVHRLDVSSTDSGADDPTSCGGTGAVASTYFDASFCNAGIRRGLTVNTSLVIQAVNDRVPTWHMIIVIVNSTVYGGSGGQVAVFSLAPGANEIALHEMGHTAFGLADEYEYFAGCGVDKDHNTHSADEPSQPNVTTNSNRETLKWRDLIAAGTPIPTTRNADCDKCDPNPSPVAARTVGAFEGAHYYHCGAFRPEFNCRMRALGQPFCAVCERVIRQTLAVFFLLPRDDFRVFDATFYLQSYADLSAAFGNDTAAARNHWLQNGIREGRRASREFDVQFYLGTYADLQNAFGTNYGAALDHWLNQGLTYEGRRGSREFDVQFYLMRYDDLRSAFGTNYRAASEHWIRQGLPAEGRRGSLEFDVQFYLGHYGDLSRAFGTNYPAAMDHWIRQGSPQEGRRGSREFDVQFYLAQYGDLRNAFGTNYRAATEHWIHQGLLNEGRRGSREFDVSYYLNRYVDLKNTFGTHYSAASGHWVRQGLPNEGRQASSDFDVQFYLANYADLQAAFGTNYTAAIDHWINQGFPNEGRRGVP